MVLAIKLSEPTGVDLYMYREGLQNYIPYSSNKIIRCYCKESNEYILLKFLSFLIYTRKSSFKKLEEITDEICLKLLIYDIFGQKLFNSNKRKIQILDYRLEYFPISLKIVSSVWCVYIYRPDQPTKDSENNLGSRAEEVFEWLTNIFHVAGGDTKDSTHDHKTWKLGGYTRVHVYYKGKYRIMKKKLTVIPIL